jgi:hypothetical protein
VTAIKKTIFVDNGHTGTIKLKKYELLLCKMAAQSNAFSSSAVKYQNQA